MHLRNGKEFEEPMKKEQAMKEEEGMTTTSLPAIVRHDDDPKDQILPPSETTPRIPFPQWLKKSKLEK